MPLEQYAQISNIKVAYASTPTRKELYDQLRNKSAREIARAIETAEKVAEAERLRESTALARAREEEKRILA